MAQSWQLSSRSCQISCVMSKNTIRPSVRRERDGEREREREREKRERGPKER